MYTISIQHIMTILATTSMSQVFTTNTKHFHFLIFYSAVFVIIPIFNRYYHARGVITIIKLILEYIHYQ